MNEYRRTDLQSGQDKKYLLGELNSFLSIETANPDEYLASKTALSANAEQLVRVYDRVRGVLKRNHKVLDWGCRHGVFGFLARLDLGDKIEIHGCDVCDPTEYQHHHVAANLRY
jgi:hypothetical protein